MSSRNACADGTGRRNVLKALALAGAGGLIAAPAAAVITSDNSAPDLNASAVERWGMAEFALSSPAGYANPFREVQLTARFESGAEALTVTGFYDGGQTWRLRFMPPTAGEWRFTTISNDQALNGRTGQLHVTAPTKSNHGPVRVQKRFHFGHADQTAFYPLGTTTYGIFQQSRAAELRMMGTLAGMAFNKARIFVMPGGFALGGEANCPFAVRDGKEVDFDRFNPEFFRRYEQGIASLQALGIEADLILFNPYDVRGKFSRLPEAQDQAFLRYAAARFAAYRNVWWTLTNEFDLFPQFGIEKRWRMLGETLAAADPYHHLLGIHNSCVGFYDNSEPWITHVILQDVSLQRLTAEPRSNSAMALDARRFGKPVVVDEYGYEGNLAMTWGSLSPSEVVGMHWSITMAGAYGSHGESYSRTQPGTFAGLAPERLAFLKRVMMDAPYQDLQPLPDAIHEPNAAITVLGAPGRCYLFHFDPPREKASWNPGFFGPATPFHPQPIQANAVDPNTWNAPSPSFSIEEGIYKVELIDPWLMKTFALGYTSGAVQQFRSMVTPGLVRLTRVQAAPAGETVQPVAKLMRGGFMEE